MAFSEVLYQEFEGQRSTDRIFIADDFGTSDFFSGKMLKSYKQNRPGIEIKQCNVQLLVQIL